MVGLVYLSKKFPFYPVGITVRLVHGGVKSEPISRSL